MPSLRKKVAGFMRQLSISNLAGVVETIGHGEQTLRSPRSLTQDFSSGCFITRYLDGLETKQEGPAILHGRNPEELPVRQLGNFQECRNVIAAHSGPDNGLTTVNVQQRHLSINDIDIDYIDMLDQGEQYRNTSTATIPTIAGIADWFNPHEKAYGIATTLYEKNPTNNINNGEPIADCFGIVARSNSAILALADGVNWGTKASIAARSAVHGSMEYLNKALFCPPINGEMTTTKDVFIALLRSFHAAHSLILQEQGMLTTLTVCVVLPLPSSDSNTEQTKYIACSCNVGDSLAYVYSRKTGVREITRGSHDIHCMRDMRDALGALGPVDGSNPELNNLTLAMTEVEKGDIVFLTSDGISDNFDPVVGKFAILPCNNSVPDSNVKSHTDGRTRTRRKSAENLRHPESGNSNSNRNKSNLPVVEAYQRHELTLLRIEDLLRRGVSGEGPPCNSAKHLCELLLDFAVRITAAKRRILEDTDLYYAQNKDGQLIQLSKQEQRTRRIKTLDKVSMIPGKLDHATVVAYVVGSISEYNNL